MAKYWFARPDDELASNWAFTPISWEGHAAIYVPLVLGSMLAKLILDRMPQGELGEFGPIFGIAGVTLGSLLLLLLISWGLFRGRIDWNHHARDYKKGVLITGSEGIFDASELGGRNT